MVLYMTVWETAECDRNYQFTGTMADERKLIKSIKQDGNTLVSSQEVSVPTDKKGLMEFLNTCRVRSDLDNDVDLIAADEAEAA